MSSRLCLPCVRGSTHRRVPSLHRHSPASSLLRTPPPPSRLRLISRWTGSTASLASADVAAGRGGFLPLLRVSLSPCCRSHPAGVDRRVSQTATTHAAFAFTGAGSASGAPHVRGHRCVRVRYGLETRPHPDDEAVERLQKVGVPSPCSPSSRALAFPLGGLSPTEHASLRWTHNRGEPFPCSTALQWGRSTASGPQASRPLPRLSSSTCGPSPCRQLCRPRTPTTTL